MERFPLPKAGFLSTIKDIFTKGLLEAVAGKDISDNKADTSAFPSKTAGIGSSSGEGGSFASAPHKRLILAEYIAGHFGNYIDQHEDSELLYEMEYILSGKASDRDNLKVAVR